MFCSKHFSSEKYTGKLSIGFRSFARYVLKKIGDVDLNIKCSLLLSEFIRTIMCRYISEKTNIIKLFCKSFQLSSNTSRQTWQRKQAHFSN